MLKHAQRTLHNANAHFNNCNLNNQEIVWFKNPEYGRQLNLSNEMQYIVVQFCAVLESVLQYIAFQCTVKCSALYLNTG